MWKLHKECLLDNSASRFSPDIVSQAIKNNCSSFSTSSDDLTIHHLKNLSSLGLQYLTDLCNLSINRCNFPAFWKHVFIIPVPEAGKPADLGTSYCSISLIYSTVKVLVRLLQPELKSLPLSPNHPGFRPNHSILLLANKIGQVLINPVPHSTH